MTPGWEARLWNIR
jgi:hypothetical protein